MKVFPLFFLWLTLNTIPVWLTDFNAAKLEATHSNKLILLNFSGSDWCLPCIRLKKDVFEKDVFTSYASEHLVLMNADFPRRKKNSLPGEQKNQNEALAEKYNPYGIFPLTILLTPEGTELRRWEGNTFANADEFMDQLKKASESWKIN